ncbi:MAG: ArsI/CadI family heavy metal resistance metalloenzyme [Bacteroidota bacterium]
MKRIHIMLNVSSLAKAKKFYSALLGTTPTKEKPDYLQWKIDNPSLNLSIESNPEEAFGVNHMGIEAGSEEELQSLYQQAKNANVAMEEEGLTTCCYAKSQKSWAKDADQNEWELFTTYQDNPSYYESAVLSK